MDFVVAIRTEISSLEQSLRESPDPRLVKLHELERLLAIYNGDAVPTALAAESPRSLAGVAEIAGARKRVVAPGRQAALEAARDILSKETEPMRTSAIYEQLVMRNITLAGKEPVNNLSALLYHNDEFVSHGRAGWTIKNAADHIPPKEKPVDDKTLHGPSTGFDSNDSRPVEPVPGGGT